MLHDKFDELKKQAVDRMKICIQCEEFRSNIKQCKQCGCFMPAKVLMSKMKCPLDKW